MNTRTNLNANKNMQRNKRQGGKEFSEKGGGGGGKRKKKVYKITMTGTIPWALFYLLFFLPSFHQPLLILFHCSWNFD